jgi:hypothetical protein
MVITFVDFRFAFGSVSHDFMLHVLRALGVPIKVCRLIAALYRGLRARVRSRSWTLSEEFIISRGVQEGDPASPELFISVLAVIMSRIMFHPSQLSNSQLIAHLEYADDVALCNASLDDAQEDLLGLEREAAPAKLGINAAKSKYMVVAKAHGLGPTTEQDVAALGLTHLCPNCSRVSLLREV